MAENRKVIDCEKYEVQQWNGQRIVQVRCRDDLREPPRGCEVFVGKLPRNMDEAELLQIFETVGDIYELRLMVAFSEKLNRGYAFVRYFTYEDASLAIRKLHGFEIRKSCRIGVYKSIDNTRLYVGGVPTDKTKEELAEKLAEYTNEDFNIIMYPAYVRSQINRGYIFMEFLSHQSAAIARRQLPNGAVKLWDSHVKIDWADPLPDADPTVMQQVTALYIRNIPVAMSSEEFRRFVTTMVESQEITRVHKQLDYAFVHMRTRSMAEVAKMRLNGSKIADRYLEIMWARPDIYSTKKRINDPPAHFCLSLPAKMRWMVKQKSTRLAKDDLEGTGPFIYV